MRYIATGTPTVIFAGEEYGTGSSRDWAAKGTAVLGIKAVVARSFERIHCSNRIGMGVLPLQFKAGTSWETLGLKGNEIIDVVLGAYIKPLTDATLVITDDDGTVRMVTVLLRIDTPIVRRPHLLGGVRDTRCPAELVLTRGKESHVCCVYGGTGLGSKQDWLMARVWLWFAVLVSPLLGTGCGDDSNVVTPLPQALTITPASPEVGVDQAFTSSLGAPAAGLVLSWDFGDGSAASNAASPTHRFAASGDYTVRLSVTNEAGETIRAENVVSARRMAWVAALNCSGAQQSGWCTPPPPPFWDVADPQFFGNSTAFRLSATTWMGSDDGGQSFTPRLPAANATVISVHAADAQNAWMVWTDPANTLTLSRTLDGGRTWSSLRTLVAPDTGYQYRLNGNGPRLLLGQIVQCGGGRWSDCLSSRNELSLDGGANWTVLPPSIGLHFRIAQITPSGSVTWVACENTVTGFCTRVSAFRAYSAEAGIQEVPFPYAVNEVGLRAQSGDTLLQFVHVSANSSVFAPRDLLLWRSSDGGRSWSPRIVPPQPPLPQSAFSGDTLQIRQRRCGNAVCELLEINGNGPQPYTSMDGGASWTPAPVNPYLRFDALGDVLLDVTLRRTSVDGGITWQSAPESSAPDSSDTLVSTGGALWMLDRRDRQEANIYRSADAGRTWSLAWMRKNPYLGVILASWVFADGRVLAQTESGQFESTDGGGSWSFASAATFGVRRMTCFDASTCFASGASAYPQPMVFINSNDSGRTWATQALPLAGLTVSDTNDIQALPDGTLWLAGRDTNGIDSVWRLPPQSSQWERMGSAPNARSGSLQFTSTTRGFLLDSFAGLYHSDDSGRTWQAVPYPSGPANTYIRASHFVDDRVGWLVGDAGRVLHTRDAGATWTPQSSGTTDTLLAVGALDAYTVWVRGADGFAFSSTAGR